MNFGVKQGEVVGIVGRNGAGKSTLLKILSRITEPTSGRIHLKGRVASLLEVGTGFHPELTGRENIYLNGAILGMTRLEIKRKFDEIVAFSEVEKFLDTPVKRYSSGMYVRLAFAVAAHLEPEILIVDEVLAVGDVAFQKKCLAKIESVSSREGRTVVFVSHNIFAVNRLCTQAILLDSGKVLATGKTQHISKLYQTVALPRQARVDWPDSATAPGSDIARLRSIRVVDAQGADLATTDITLPFFVEMVFDVLKSGHKLTPNLHFFSDEGQCLFVALDHDPAWRNRPRPTGQFRCRLAVPGNFLTQGWVSVRGALTTFEPFRVHFDVEDAIGFMVEDTGRPDSARGDYVGVLPGVIRPLLQTSNHYTDNSSNRADDVSA